MARNTDWTSAPYAQRKTHIVTLLENLEHQDSLVRYQASRRLLYLLQGEPRLSRDPTYASTPNRFFCGKYFPREPVTVDSRKCKRGQRFTRRDHHRRCVKDALRQTRSTDVRPFFHSLVPLSPILTPSLSLYHDVHSAISDADLARVNAAPHMRQSWLDEVQAEISMCLGMLYPIIEVFRSDSDFAEDLSKFVSLPRVRFD